MRKLTLLSIALCALAACAESPSGPDAASAPGGAANLNISGAIYTTSSGCTGVNINQFPDKDSVYLDGGPNSENAQGLPAGFYWVQVTTPDGDLLGWSNGAVAEVGSDGRFVDCYQLSAILLTASDSTPGYDDTSNGGGEYKVWISTGPDFKNNASKTDNFKVIRPAGPVEASGLSASKDAAGAYDDAYAWTIAKAVDQTSQNLLYGAGTFNYTVTLTHDAGTISNVTVAGTITITNPNASAVAIDGITDVLSDATACTVTNGGAQSLASGATQFAYTCSLAGLPSSITNTATVSWSEQTLGDGSHLAAGSANTAAVSVAFTANVIDGTVNVTDTFGSTAGALGTVSVGDANPTAFSYSRSVTVPPYGCVSAGNTAAFTTNTTGATGSASQSVSVCRVYPQTGARTMGFWKGPNGQSIIKTQGTSGVCGSTAFLRGYAPFQDLSATATCSQVATYVNNVLGAASAGGAAMNAMLKGQMLATALDVYFTGAGYTAANSGRFLPNSNIGGLNVDLTVICSLIGGEGICNGGYQNVSAAFGGSSAMRVSDMLAFASAQSNIGGSAWYGQNKTTQGLAKNAFDAINNRVAFQAGP